MYINFFAEVSLIIYKYCCVLCVGSLFVAMALVDHCEIVWTLTVRCVILVFPHVGHYWIISQDLMYVVNAVRS